MTFYDGGEADDGRSHVILLDPEEAAAVRVEGREFEDGIDRIMVTYDHPEIEVRVCVQPDDFMAYVVAVLNALGFPEGDLEYLSDRFEKEFR